MTTTFSDDGAKAIERSTDILETGSRTDASEIDDVYEIERTCNFITNHAFKRVALQFPDELLIDASAIISKLEKNTSTKIFILGDTSYGSCCVDEVAAEHLEADSIIHYGRACLSPTRRLPVMYVFGQKSIDLYQCAASFRALYPDKSTYVIILYDVIYSYALDELQQLLQPEYENLVVSTVCSYRNGTTDLCGTDGLHSESDVVIQGSCNHASNQPSLQVINKFGRQFTIHDDRSVNDYDMFYVGQESPTLTNFMMTWNRCSFCSFDPVKGVGRQETVNINKALMKRYYMIERAKDAQVVGILIGTLGVADYLSTIDHLKWIVKQSGKKSYTFVMGKLNVAKLANFLEVDIYVLVACPENSLLDSSEFYRPVITPYEMEVACNQTREWTGEYVTDFRDLLPGACSHVQFPDENFKSEETNVSLITGNLRATQLLKSEGQINASSTSLIPRNDALAVTQSHSAASFLKTRSWKGLEQKLGETPVSKAVEGRKGIAIAYEEEGTS
ncbi:2-(3-amino-3-carboxypropyl)histidine synthase subunit 2 [Pristis pectinata]|uniref:2-(3-amino-3-carboxypropyl)histidine synthase subunit 2 n=1 Tax=Pristis pectinata TaxID=685728 RepID=UPI00223D85F3|nr:2-(3-amino-3-carboxypropyl)histidine synthase subunit 2 [Pristis pectinata]XP_051867898.1 2-(3-amino-3-carboxypropyl)histidine synthase subunit 2 [Pristis pectinata]XP_051867899.1 2-(3-amino-3-carboxypropyl)histidine synthase subunit 2 [Pristis pectinata]XP_051867900.1 2-(3-amino-3-carboxypropyl)histidine synthase subunit 2 [Pristis pectinata]XP_051867901.1 2-(3-amino-3-carboxypropyl)histidine synthase subunit 2 [Pristis pectinata]